MATLVVESLQSQLQVQENVLADLDTMFHLSQKHSLPVSSELNYLHAQTISNINSLRELIAEYREEKKIYNQPKVIYNNKLILLSKYQERLDLFDWYSLSAYDTSEFTELQEISQLQSLFRAAFFNNYFGKFSKTSSPSSQTVEVREPQIIFNDKIITLSEYQEMLKQHDWHYQFSDDMYVRRGGEENELVLRAIATEHWQFHSAFNEQYSKIVLNSR